MTQPQQNPWDVVGFDWEVMWGDVMSVESAKWYYPSPRFPEGVMEDDDVVLLLLRNGQIIRVRPKR